MAVDPTSPAAAFVPSWDGEGRRTPGGPLAGDPPGGGSLSFGDVLAALNPLQHIPIVGSIYRWITGDAISPVARVVGGALFGGPIGLVSAALNATIEQVKGKDLGEQAIASLFGPADDTPAAVTGAPVAAAAGPSADPRAGADAPGPAPVLAAAAPAAPGPARPTTGRSLAFYQAHAGQRLAPVDTRAQGPVQTAPVRPVLPAAAQAQARPDDAAPAEAPPAAWFSEAMRRGLDRYRAMQRPAAAPQVDMSF